MLTMFLAYIIGSFYVSFWPFGPFFGGLYSVGREHGLLFVARYCVGL